MENSAHFTCRNITISKINNLFIFSCVWAKQGKTRQACLHLANRVYDFTAKIFWAEVKTGRNVNRDKAYLVESQFRIKLKL